MALNKLHFLYDDILSSASYAFVLFVAIAFVYHLITFLKFKIKIWTECWFCMKKTQVCIANRNCWTCRFCLQYNGFSKDGSYNKVIEDQHEYDDTSYCQRASNVKYEQHRLCDACNRNQEVKVKLLADFVPFDEANFDKEVNEFRKHIESQYKLCYSCELLLQKVLDRPSSLNFRKFHPRSPTLLSRDGSTRKMSSTDGIQKSKVSKCWSLIWPLFAFSVILFTMYYLFELSNQSYIFQQSAKYNYFRKPYSDEHAKIYGQIHLIAAVMLCLLYYSLAYFAKTFHRYIDFIVLVLLFIMIANNFQYNMFALTHDTLVEYHQSLIAASFFFVVLTIILNFVNLFIQTLTEKASSIASRENDDNAASHKAKTFNFAKFSDETTIREQIKELCLSDLDSSLGKLDTTSSNVSAPNHLPTNVFSQYSTFHLPSANFLQCGGMIKTPSSFSCFQYKVSNSNMFKSNLISESIFGQTHNDQLNELSPKSCLQSDGSHRVLNYFVNYNQPLAQPSSSSSEPSSKTVYSNYTNWLFAMFHTFELILFLVIVGLIVVLLSMPITLSYNSDFNSFDFNIAVYNLSKV